MGPGQITEFARDLFYTAMLVAMPAMAVSLIIGLIVSIFQTVTSIQDQTLSYVPRIILVGFAITLTMAFTLDIAVGFTRRMFLHAAGVGQ